MTTCSGVITKWFEGRGFGFLTSCEADALQLAEQDEEAQFYVHISQVITRGGGTPDIAVGNRVVFQLPEQAQEGKRPAALHVLQEDGSPFQTTRRTFGQQDAKQGHLVNKKRKRSDQDTSRTTVYQHPVQDRVQEVAAVTAMVLQQLAAQKTAQPSNTPQYMSSGPKPPPAEIYHQPQTFTQPAPFGAAPFGAFAPSGPTFGPFGTNLPPYLQGGPAPFGAFYNSTANTPPTYVPLQGTVQPSAPAGQPVATQMPPPDCVTVPLSLLQRLPQKAFSFSSSTCSTLSSQTNKRMLESQACEIHDHLTQMLEILHPTPSEHHTYKKQSLSAWITQTLIFCVARSSSFLLFFCKAFHSLPRFFPVPATMESPIPPHSIHTCSHIPSQFSGENFENGLYSVSISPSERTEMIRHTLNSQKLFQFQLQKCTPHPLLFRK